MSNFLTADEAIVFDYSKQVLILNPTSTSIKLLLEPGFGGVTGSKPG